LAPRIKVRLSCCGKYEQTYRVKGKKKGRRKGEGEGGKKSCRFQPHIFF
jgi:hypothetical protein